MKKYLLAAGAAVTAAVAAAALAAPATAAPTAPSVSTASASAPAPGAPAASAPTGSVSAVRTVRSGERVDAGGGYTLWLTRQGKHWTGPDGFEQFRSVVDGNLDLTQPALSHQGEGDFHSGVYGGPHRPGRVELTDAEGRVTRATLLQLPGRPDWGVWYAHTAPTGHDVSVSFYARDGRLLVELPAMDF
ncbi:hypothetical protein [Streptomyces omiyaensis]|uniref:hypothetical protein n=1 Tax=Streptomyces omiyaensis TaxID=68247 RepID=UPI00167C23B5|nr:hypothetical protein [Streptomyces omiyaensis]GGY44083.1 hypothetical protein GCM10010363_26230 [Streptomyces omiyaensis]